MNLDDIRPALEQFSKAANDKINATARDVDAIKQKQAEHDAQLSDLEQRGAKRGGSDGRHDRGDLVKTIQDSEHFALAKKGAIGTCRFELEAGYMGTKAAMTSGTSGISAILEPERLPGMVTPAQRRLTIRDLIPVIPTAAPSIEYLRETSFTNNAAPVAEAALKPQSDIAFEKVSSKIITIAHWMHASKQLLDDVPQLVAYLDNRLRYGLRYQEELQLLMGAGTGENLSGLYVLATNYSAPFTLTTPTMIDIVRSAQNQLENSNYIPNGIVLHPNDWARIELIKTDDGSYLKSNPDENGRRVLWGMPVVTTTAMTEDKFLVGAFSQAAMLFDRQDPTLDIATQDQDDFVKNLIKLRVEERVGMSVSLPGALVKGDLGNLP